MIDKINNKTNLTQISNFIPILVDSAIKPKQKQNKQQTTNKQQQQK